jgi:hypothetical protein
MNQQDRAAQLAGVLAGMAGLLVFLVIHALWILPIRFILPIGLAVAGLGGLAVGRAYAELQSRLPKRPGATLAVVALISVILLPAFLLAELRPPMFLVSAAGVANLTMSVSEATIRFIGELLLTATLTGGLLGWWLGRTRRAAVATAVAEFVFALGPGHNIPFIGGTSGVGKEVAIMTGVVVVSAIVLVEGYVWLQSDEPKDEGLTDE